MAQETDFTEELLFAPHPKPQLMTRLGRAIEKLSYPKLLLAAFLFLAISTSCFWLIPGCLSTSDGHDARSFPNALYFSFVTFTTLGYGDLIPQGFGRLLACILVMVGLAVFSLLVGKIASERQYAMLLLLHTSDCQRRLQRFREDIAAALERVSQAVSAHDSHSINRQTKSLVQLLEATANYVVFHLHQSRLAEFGNDSGLNALKDALELMQSECCQVFRSKFSSPRACERCLKTSDRCLKFVRLIVRFQSEQWSGRRRPTQVSALPQMGPPANADAKRIQRMQAQVLALERYARTEQSEWIVSKVKSHLAMGPRSSWPALDHKRVAKELRISNSLATRCIAALIQRGECP